ncbi:MAG: stage V sporulation protein AC [Oscillospiraceae bacterium]|nr:stage V sporulation protein AC [Oscillospiraceae bacterium]
MPITPKEYGQISGSASRHTNILKTVVFAFLTGGTICCIGEVLLKLYSAVGLDEKTASATVSMTLVFLSVTLTGIGVYDKIAKFGGAGSLVPITGFANAVASPAIEFKSEGYVLGLGAKMFIIAGPVIVYGTAASVLYGLILWIFRLY